MNTEKFELSQQQMSNEGLVKLAKKEVHKLCETGGKSLRMCVPPMITDTDMILCEIINRFETLSEYSSSDKCILEIEVGSFEWALQLMKIGKFVKRSVVKNDTVIVEYKSRFYQMSTKTGVRYPYTPTNADISSTDWEGVDITVMKSA